MLGKAISIASRAFEDVKDKGGQPYILHCLRVMDNLHTNDEELKIIAVLHDVCEDTSIGINTLLDLGFSLRVAAALDLLTHKKEVPYDDYIKAIALNNDARLVKLADLKDNTDVTRLKGLSKKDFDRMEKYHRSYMYLSKV